MVGAKGKGVRSNRLDHLNPQVEPAFQAFKDIDHMKHKVNA